MSGGGQPDDIALVRELCEVIASAGGCALAEKTAGNVLFTLEKYADAWEQHCRRKRCPALVCKAYYAVYCVPEKCRGCTECMKACPAGAISGGEGLICVVDEKSACAAGSALRSAPTRPGANMAP